MSVYFLQLHDDRSGPVKIGYTAGDVPTRISSLQTGSPARLRWLLTIRDAPKRVEKALQWYLREFCVRGEWFEHQAAREFLPIVWVEPRREWVEVDGVVARCVGGASKYADPEEVIASLDRIVLDYVASRRRGFIRWLRAYRGTSIPTIDLAEDLKLDRGAPRSGTAPELMAYLRKEYAWGDDLDDVVRAAFWEWVDPRPVWQDGYLALPRYWWAA